MPQNLSRRGNLGSPFRGQSHLPRTRPLSGDHLSGRAIRQVVRPHRVQIEAMVVHFRARRGLQVEVRPHLAQGLHPHRVQQDEDDPATVVRRIGVLAQFAGPRPTPRRPFHRFQHDSEEVPGKLYRLNTVI